MRRLSMCLGFCVLLVVAFCQKHSAEPLVHLHYLGHAAFLITFDNGVTILTDYGESNSYGLNSPVYDFGNLRPDVVTYSHDHADHAGGRIPENVPHVLRGTDSLDIQGISIRAIPTYERTLQEPDNSSFLFAYKGFKILHLGDCQGLIEAVGREEAQNRIRSLYPDTYDLVMVPIGYVTDVVEPAAEFVSLIKARRVIPVHYWDPEDKATFLSILSEKTETNDAAYRFNQVGGAAYALSQAGAGPFVTEIVSLDPAPYVSSSKETPKSG